MSTNRVVTIGGGTGTFVTLSALKTHAVKLSAIVSMMDSGGSTGRLRDQLGVLPPGDIRQALVALANESRIWRELFTYRFDAGDLAGHTFGNIFLSTLEKMAGSLPKAISISQRLLQVKGTVLPVTLAKAALFAQLSDGTIIEGEAQVDQLGQDWTVPVQNIAKCWVAPKADATKEALRAINTADYILVGPGDLHTSILPNFLVDGVAKAVVASKAKKIFIANLMTKRGHTDNFTTSDFIATLSAAAHGLVFDYVLVNNGTIDQSVVGWYHQTCEVAPVVNDLVTTNRTQVVAADIVSTTSYGKTVSDRIQRSLIRHDVAKLGQALLAIMTEHS
jgi:uncharacterized cofD-like protein